MTAGAAVRTALPYILAGGALGVLLGAALGSPANGFRLGVIPGGVVAFVAIRRKKRDSS